ncbi:MAG TPA: YebC/PmpR family DNA-binding transcriptional regulator [Nitrospiria bacterium]|nr:YebC/PmpR family DNA-binding transcriptional regulator [Nitrospiria bacterium]
MGGHSHWSTIKRKKGAEDAKRGKVFTKIIREITTAARVGGGDPNGNPRLRLAIVKAKDVNMPADNIKKAIQRGTGELPGVHYEEAVYEGYGPGGVALLIETTSDNKNRSVSEIRNLLEKNGGRMADAGSVAWMFHRKGRIVVDKSKADEEKLMNLVLEAGAEDLRTEDDSFEVITPPHDFEHVRKVLDGQKIEMVSAEVASIPQNYVNLQGKDAEQMLKLMEALEDHDDVQNIHANFDIPQDVMEKVAAK